MKNALKLNLQKAILLLVLIILAISACKKDVPPDLLRDKTWKWTKKDLNPATNPSGTVFYHSVLECAEDDVISFSKDGKYKIARGKVPCDPQEESPYVRNFTIDLIGKKFTINDKQYQLLELTDKQFKFAEASPVREAHNMVYMMVH